MFQIYGLVLQGRMEESRHMLSIHPSADQDPFLSMDEMLRKMPVYQVCTFSCLLLCVIYSIFIINKLSIICIDLVSSCEIVYVRLTFFLFFLFTGQLDFSCKICCLFIL